MSIRVLKKSSVTNLDTQFTCRSCRCDGTAFLFLEPGSAVCYCEKCVKELHSALTEHIKSLKPKPPVPVDPLEAYSKEFMKEHSYVSTVRKRFAPIPRVDPGAAMIIPTAEECGFQCPCVMTKIRECKACGGEKFIWFQWSSVHKKELALLNIVNRFRTANGLGASFTALKVS